mmetsp:Transcript_21433/g.27720  ORF Transcript_21433/g.27720 Transcript_21433/m.27720 type:complete len:312 (+) Transcript_21433:179-1114(+)
MSAHGQDSKIPVIDMRKETSAIDLVNAFETIGFATLIHHGVDDNAMQTGFDASSRFFALPESTKMESRYQSHSSNRGYIAFQTEAHSATPELKETFDIGWDEGSEFDTPWPKSELLEMKEQLMNYFTACDALYLRVMRLLGEGMKLEDPDFFVKRCNEKHCNLRLLHYPELTDQAYQQEPVLVRGGRHTDFGIITILQQDSVGGLRLQKRGETEWFPVPPMPNSFLVNVGDMLQRWTNDRLLATPHQVVFFNDQDNNDDEKVIPERFSVAFFCNANKEVVLDPAVFSEKPKYEPMKAIDYITGRLADTIAM